MNGARGGRRPFGLPLPVGAVRTRVGCGALLAALLAAGCEEVTVSTPDVAQVRVEPGEISLQERRDTALVATVTDGDGNALTGRTVSWSSDDPDVADVGGDGRVTAASVGSTTIRAQVQGEEGTASVTVTPGALIRLSVGSLEFEAVEGRDPPPVREVEVTNEGEGELAGLDAEVVHDDGDSWLTADLAASDAPTRMHVGARSGGLPPGEYSGAVLVRSDDGLNSPVELPVFLEVREPPPVIELDPSSVSFSSTAGIQDPASQTVAVENAGGRTLTSLSASVEMFDAPNQNWLSARLEDSEAPTELIVQVRASWLRSGTYRGEVEVSSPVAEDGPAVVSVTFTVGE